MRYLLALIFLIQIFKSKVNGQTVIPLYNKTIPNSKPLKDAEKTDTLKDGIFVISRISIPTLTIFLPPKDIVNGSAVIICPGGGYNINAIKHEGTDVAKELNKAGIAAFVLKYRIPDEATMLNTSIGPLQDAQRAIIIVRENAKEWNLDTNRIGIMGFSAGGHLASSLGTHYQKALVDNPKKINLRPDFMILIYPVISGDTTVDKSNSVKKLLGKNYSPDLVKEFSNETKVTTATPPTFLMQSGDDPIGINNSLVFYEALIKNKVPAEVHLYQSGGHGYGMNNKTTTDNWMARLINWMMANGWMKK